MIACLLASCIALPPPPLPGEILKPFVVQTRSGQEYAWAPGKVTVICFCAMWCNTWKQQFPRLLKAEEQLKGLPVEYLAISVDGRWIDRVKGAAYASLLADRGGRWAGSIGINRVPYTLVLDEKGRIRSSTFGTLRSDDIVLDVRSALGSRKAGPIYLTFDGVSDEILDVLREKDVKATFFCSSTADSQANRAKKEGHSIETLGARPNGGAVFAREAGQSSIRGKDGKPLHFFVDDPFDLARPGESELLRRVVNLARPRAVIYLHAGVGETVSVLPKVIENLRSRGFAFELLASGQT